MTLRRGMGKPRSWWQLRRIKHRDGVILCVLSSSFLLAGQLTAPILVDIYEQYLEPVRGDLILFGIRSGLAVFGFTTAFGAVLVLLGGWYFLRGRVGRGRTLVALGIGFTALSFASRLAYHMLVFGSPVSLLLTLGPAVTGLGALFGLMAHIAMSEYALLLKKRAHVLWRRWKRGQRARMSRA